MLCHVRCSRAIFWPQGQSTRPSFFVGRTMSAPNPYDRPGYPQQMPGVPMQYSAPNFQMMPPGPRPLHYQHHQPYGQPVTFKAPFFVTVDDLNYRAKEVLGINANPMSWADKLEGVSVCWATPWGKCL